MKIFLAAAGGGWNWFQRAFWPDQENIKARESILNMKIHLAGGESRAEILAEESKVLRPYILESFLMTTPKKEKGSEQAILLYSFVWLAVTCVAVIVIQHMLNNSQMLPAVIMSRSLWMR
nr:MAG TPA: hypothetical protein [Caudoviricetes sp.]